MQANNKGDLAQVYEGATRATKIGFKDSFKYILKPLSIFFYHYFIEGIKSVQKDGPTKELEKIINLSYDETIKVMEKCQYDGIRVVATERKLTNEDNKFGKKKSLFRQKRITKYVRRIKSISNLKSHCPRLAKILNINKLIEINEQKQQKQIQSHHNKRYNIYFNKAKQGYMAERIEDIIAYRTKISKDLFKNTTQEAIEEIEKEDMLLNAQQLKELSEKLNSHEIGEIDIEEFKSDYCIHSLPFSAFLGIEDNLEGADIPFGINVDKDDENNKIANIYFESKHLERYSELEFNRIGQMYVYGKDNKNIKFDVDLQDEVMSFKTQVGKEERQTYSALMGKSYVMKKDENECIWTILKNDIVELTEKEKKRNVVDEDIEKYNIFEKLENEITNHSKTIENMEVTITDEKEIN